MISKELLMDTDTWYIQDGLELHLDGIYNDSYINRTHVDNPRLWKDLSGNDFHFRMTNTTTKEDSFVFTGSCYGRNDFSLEDNKLNEVLTGIKNRTIEVVCKLDNNTTVQAIFLGVGNATTYGAGLWYRPASNGMKTNTATVFQPFITPNVTERFSYSTTYNKGHYTATASYQNGNNLSKTSAAGNMTNATYITIGSRYSGQAWSYFFKGEICAIRVYNRELTEKERKHNLALDMRRFGISANGAVIDE